MMTYVSAIEQACAGGSPVAPGAQQELGLGPRFPPVGFIDFNLPQDRLNPINRTDNLNDELHDCAVRFPRSKMNTIRRSLVPCHAGATEPRAPEFSDAGDR